MRQSKYPKFILSMFFIFSLITLSGSLFAGDQNRYNEVFDEQGQVRPHYQGVIASWASRVHHMKRYARQTFAEFEREGQESNSINDLPRMLPKAEYEAIMKGVEQRARAIQAFLKDHYSRERQYSKAGLIAEDLIHDIITRSGEQGYQSLIDGTSSTNFLYGPDIIRGPDGKFYVLEDNIGFVGGFGDIVPAQEMAERLYPEIATQYKYDKAMSFYDRLRVRYREQAQKYGGKVIFYSDPYLTDDSEEIRTMELFEELGIEVVAPSSQRKLSFEADGVYVQNANGNRREKVGFIVLNIEHDDADLSVPAALEKAVLVAAAGFVSDREEGPEKLRLKVLKKLMQYDPKQSNKEMQIADLRKLLKDTAYRVTQSRRTRENRGLVQAILEGRVGSSYSPGLEFVGDKQTYIYIEDFIRFYLKEEPILRNVETYMFNQAGTQKVSEVILDKVFGKDRRGRGFANWVIKPVDGRGGDGIIFGSRTKTKDIPGIIAKISEAPQKFLAQKNTPPSVMPGNRIVDIRALTYSTREKSIVSPVPWSRAATADDSLLINVSAGGAVLPVFVIEPKGVQRPSIQTKNCKQILKGA